MDSAGVDVVTSDGLLLVASAGFEDVAADDEDVLLEDVLSCEDVELDEVFVAEGSISFKTLPP